MDQAAREIGVDEDAIRAGLAGFGGVKRRFTTTGVAHGVRVIDDYGHHPVEIAAVLKAARAVSTGKVIAVVQPHRYTRLASLFDDFCTCFNDADTVIVAPVYAATKAYVLSLSEALWSEGKRKGVHVLAVCPGATDTEFFDVAGDGSAMKSRRTTEQVVDTAFKALEAGKPSVVDGLVNRIGAYGARLAPRRLVLAIAERAVS